jgi:hypothetical protein
MTSIVVTKEQADIIKSAKAIEVRGPHGEWLGVLSSHGFTEEDVRLAKEALASQSPRYTTAQVLEHLRSLESK